MERLTILALQENGYTILEAGVAVYILNLSEKEVSKIEKDYHITLEHYGSKKYQIVWDYV